MSVFLNHLARLRCVSFSGAWNLDQRSHSPQVRGEKSKAYSRKSRESKDRKYAALAVREKRALLLATFFFNRHLHPTETMVCDNKHLLQGGIICIDMKYIAGSGYSMGEGNA